MSSPLEFIARRGGDAKTIGKLYEGSQQASGVGLGGVERVVSERIGGTTPLEKFMEAIDVASQWTLMASVGNTGAQHFKRSVEKDDGSGVLGKELAIGRLNKRAPTERKDRRAGEGGENVSQLMVLDSTEAAFTACGEQPGNGAMRKRDLRIEVDKRTGKLLREQAANRTLSSPHEADEDQYRR